MEHLCRIAATVAASDCPKYRLYASTAARQGRVADLKPPGLRAEEVEQVVPTVIQQTTSSETVSAWFLKSELLPRRATFV